MLNYFSNPFLNPSATLRESAELIFNIILLLYAMWKRRFIRVRDNKVFVLAAWSTYSSIFVHAVDECPQGLVQMML